MQQNHSTYYKNTYKFNVLKKIMSHLAAHYISMAPIFEVEQITFRLC